MESSNLVNRHTLLQKIGVYSIFVIFTLFTVYPLFWLGYSSLKTNSEIQNSPLAFPASPQFTNYSEAWSSGSEVLGYGTIQIGYLNSTIYLVFTLAIVIMGSMMASYVFAKSPFKKTSKILLATVGMGILISTHSVIIPLFLLLKSLGLTNTRLGIILTYSAVSMPMAVFICTDFIRGLPDSLVESAQMDGAPRFIIFTHIILPMTRPVMVTTAIITGIATWNEFLLGFILSNNQIRALPPAVIAFANPRTPNYNLQMAGLVISVLPMLILYAFFNKHITKGVVGGAIKG